MSSYGLVWLFNFLNLGRKQEKRKHDETMHVRDGEGTARGGGGGAIGV